MKEQNKQAILNKVHAVIESCDTDVQLACAIKYSSLALKQCKQIGFWDEHTISKLIKRKTKEV